MYRSSQRERPTRSTPHELLASLRTKSQPVRWAVLGAASAGTVGAVVGLIVGLYVFAPTALFAMVELGLPRRHRWRGCRIPHRFGLGGGQPNLSESAARAEGSRVRAIRHLRDRLGYPRRVVGQARSATAGGHMPWESGRAGILSCTSWPLAGRSQPEWQRADRMFSASASEIGTAGGVVFELTPRAML